MMVPVPFASQVAHKIKQPEEDQSTACQCRKQPPGFPVYGDSHPDHKRPQQSSEQNMSRPGRHGHKQSLDSAPSLPPASQNEGQPMCRYAGVKENPRVTAV